MHGGCLRFQAQYLRRIRIPRWAEVPERTRIQLSAAATASDPIAVLEAVSLLYRLTPDEIQQLTT
jgi:hypothetical protein